KNANGDLTDDGPPIEPSDLRHPESHWDYNYLLDTITPPDGSRHTEFKLRRWNYGEKQDSYGLSLTLDGKTPMDAGWFGTFWADSADKAPMIHFGGALSVKQLRFKALYLDGQTRRLAVAFTNPGSCDGARSLLSIDALPASAVPLATIDWPVAPG